MMERGEGERKKCNKQEDDDTEKLENTMTKNRKKEEVY